jgi:enoyl-CoA hydratase/carnithine racemase
MTARPFEKITTSRASGVETITLNVPDRRNAIGPQMTSELLYTFGTIRPDPDVRVVVLTGAGKAFCAGADFQAMPSQGGEQLDALPAKGDYADLLLTMATFEKPIVAKVNGHALGGGLGLVAASTFAIAADGALLGTPEIDVGLFPMMIMAVLGRLVPRRRLEKMMLLGEKLTAEEATAIGILNAHVDPGELEGAVEKLVTALAGKSPIVTRLGLKAFAAQDDLPLEKALPLLRDRLGEVLATADAHEGLSAFLEKRAPVWTGK